MFLNSFVDELCLFSHLGFRYTKHITVKRKIRKYSDFQNRYYYIGKKIPLEIYQFAKQE